MADVVTSPCVGTRDTACMKVCPVNCFYDVELAELAFPPTAEKPELTKMLIINPDECIDCGLCVPECPVAAISRSTTFPRTKSSTRSTRIGLSARTRARSTPPACHRKPSFQKYLFNTPRGP